jgi:hypothetical protein
MTWTLKRKLHFANARHSGRLAEQSRRLRGLAAIVGGRPSGRAAARRNPTLHIVAAVPDLAPELEKSRATPVAAPFCERTAREAGQLGDLV